jgi:hypothetical protein
MCLDVLRAFARDGEAARETEGCPGAAEAVESVVKSARAGLEADARVMVEKLTLLAATAALRESAPERITSLFAQARLRGGRPAMFGMSELSEHDRATLCERALPL